MVGSHVYIEIPENILQTTTKFERKQKEKKRKSLNIHDLVHFYRKRNFENNYNYIHHRLPENDKKTHLKSYIPMVPKINQIKLEIINEIVKLEKIFSDLKTLDEEEIKKLLVSIKENNIQYSSLISSELKNIRKKEKAILISKIMLDELENQISTISSFKDMVDILTQSVSVIKNVRTILSPYKGFEDGLKKISDLLSDVLVNAAQVGGHLIDFNTSNKHIKTILNDAIFKAENKIKEDFLVIPDISI